MKAFVLGLLVSAANAEEATTQDAEKAADKAKNVKPFHVFLVKFL